MGLQSTQIWQNKSIQKVLQHENTLSECIREVFLLSDEILKRTKEEFQQSSKVDNKDEAQTLSQINNEILSCFQREIDQYYSFRNQSQSEIFDKTLKIFDK